MVKSDKSWKSTLDSLARLRPQTREELNEAPHTTASIARKRHTLRLRDELLAKALALHHQEEIEIEIISRRVHNSSLLVSRLPVEIIVLILQLALPYGDHWSFAAVCSRWKDIVLGVSGASLWADLDVSLEHQDDVMPVLRQTRNYLEHSHAVPMSIRLSCSASDISRSSETDTLAELVVSVAERCVDLEVWDVEAYKRVLPLSSRWSQLAYLRLILPSDDFNSPFFLPDTELPSLKTLELDDARDLSIESLDKFFGSGLAFTTCSTLKFTGGRLDAEALAHLLGKFPMLSTLHLSPFFVDYSGDLGDGAEVADFPPIYLPLLRELDLGGCQDPHDLLSRIHAPGLHHLIVLDDAWTIVHQNPDVPFLMILFGSPPRLAELLSSRGTQPTSVRFIHDLAQLAAVLRELVASLRFDAQTTGSETLAVTAAATERLWTHKPITLSIELYRIPCLKAHEPVLDPGESKSFCLALESFALALLLRRRAGADIRFRLSVHGWLVRSLPGAAAVISRHSDLLEAGHGEYGA